MSDRITHQTRIDIPRVSDPYEPGYVLPNGAILLATKKHEWRADESIILAFNPNHVEPFVVWRRTRDGGFTTPEGERVESTDECWSGDYHRSIDTAVAAYKKRR